MARIVQQGVITTSGVSFENEPIIKADGAGEIMQWQPSDGGADGVYIIQDASSGSAELGIGVSPTTTLDVVGDVQFRSTGASNDPAQLALWATDTSIAADDVIGSIIGAGSDNADGDPHTAPVTGAKIDFIADHTWDGNSANYQSTRIDFFTQDNSGTNRLGTARMSISSTGVVSIPSGSLTLGSLDIGHGAGGEATNTAVGTDALDNSHASATHNTAIGNDALTATHTAAADYNTMIGSGAGSSITSGSSNTGVGRLALGGTDDGINNVAIGHAALDANCGNENTAVGRNALSAFTGSDATAVGYGAADTATTQTAIVSIGKDAIGALSQADGDENTAVCA